MPRTKTNPHKKHKKNQDGGVKKCQICLQQLEKVKTFQLPTATPERKTIKDPNLTIDGMVEGGEALTFKLDDFTIFDSKQHLVSLSAERLTEKESWSEDFYFVGKVLRIDGEAGGRVVMTKSSSIVGVYIDQSMFQVILETKVGKRLNEYYLENPSDVYQEFYSGYHRRALLCFIVAKRFEKAFDEEEVLEYEDIAEYCQSLTEWNGKPIERFDLEDLQNYSQFIAKHLISMENVETDHDDFFTLRNMPGALHILRQGGYSSFASPKRRSSIDSEDIITLDDEDEEDDAEHDDDEYTDADQRKKKNFKKAFTTPLVSDLFDNIFRDNITSLQQSMERRRSIDSEQGPFKEKKTPNYTLGPVLKTMNGRVLYRSLSFGLQELKPGMFIKTDYDGWTWFGHIIEIWNDDKDRFPILHVQLLEHDGTLLEDTVMQKELFKLNLCEHIPLKDVTIEIIYVEFRSAPDVSTWRMSGGQLDPASLESSCYFWRFYFCNEFGKYEYPVSGQIGATCYCDKIDPAEQDQIDEMSATIEDGQLLINKERFKINHFMYLKGEAHELLGLEYKVAPVVQLPAVPYRNQTKFHSLKADCPVPYVVIQIKKISSWNQISFIVYHRPENTTLSYEDAREKNISCLYVNRDVRTFSLKELSGFMMHHVRPVLVSGEDEDKLGEICENFPNRFYTTQEFLIKNGVGLFSDLSEGDLDNLSIQHCSKVEEEVYIVTNPLRSLDVFAGAGGLSKGLEESGVAICKWAVEHCDAAVQAFQLNHKKAKVFCEDTNKILQQLMDDPVQMEILGMPAKGEVDLIVGGPPCQGFSLLNMYNKKEYSRTKNSQIANFIGYVDFYRPRFLLIENVKNLCAFQNGEVLKLILSSLTRIGYQVEFGVLQAGHYGVAQSRLRLIILGAGPGERLPAYPDPWHVFPDNHFEDIYMCNKQILSPVRRISAPRRVITTWDIISDLPSIKSGAVKDVMPYPKGVNSHRARYYFRLGAGVKLLDHISKYVNEVNQARIDHVPTLPGSDWRDIPNREVRLSSGKIVHQLRFPYSKQVYKEKKKKYVEEHGVCECFLTTQKKCQAMEVQKDTIIPWFLHHTAHRRPGHFAGTFGRIPWGGIFKTTLTSPEPTGLQGQVLHPEQNRICSVREFARSQGFRDSFVFYGDINQKHKQIGNAVPPPLGRAIGEELKKVLISNE